MGEEKLSQEGPGFHPGMRRGSLRASSLGLVIGVGYCARAVILPQEQFTNDAAADYFRALAPDLHRHALLCPGAWFASQEEVEALASPQ